jgi:hypothetical protein
MTTEPTPNIRQLQATVTRSLLHWKKNPKLIDYEKTIIYLDSAEGQRLLSEVADTSYSQYKVLSRHFEAQKRGSFCSLASGVIVLNSLLSSEHSNEKNPLALTQEQLWETIRNPKNGFLKREEDMRYGLTLSQVAAMLRIQHHNISVTVRTSQHFDELSAWFLHDLETTYGLPGVSLRQQRELARVLSTTAFDTSSVNRTNASSACNTLPQTSSPHRRQQFIIVNFWRNFRQHSGGHVTPLAAYHPTERMVLILETNQKRASHHWIHIDVLTLLMTCIDRTSNRPRGYLIVSLLPTP